MNFTETLERAVETIRQQILDTTNAAYAALKEDPKAWRAELEERRLWEQTLSDGQAE
jgi:hypothetical protein